MGWAHSRVRQSHHFPDSSHLWPGQTQTIWIMKIVKVVARKTPKMILVWRSIVSFIGSVLP